ncbi:serine hydrolase [Flavobacterium sp. SLB02]|uniref:serine hydrolase domain-containing protein n=1 Tax=Flavobacterium sp. SLB02 TaxID=2665645 RepID=UPI0012A96B2C|nr:serine hydrolase [Flavobacterium sp. SLB02]QGK74009.1 serine hydrolase [Flavobacterium sp. SLB02]
MKNSCLFYILLFINIFGISGQTENKIHDSLLRQMTDSISGNHYKAIHSVLISRNDQVVYEQYFNGYKRDSLHDSRSSFKSITSLLVGIAIDKGFIKNVDQKVYEFFPEYPFLKTDKLKKLITIKNLVEMKSGFDCEEFNDTKDCENEMSLSKNWVEYSLNLPMKDKPGEVWAYTSIDPVILSGVIRKATNMSVMDFAKKYLFDPLEISHYKWTIDPSGNGMTAGSFYIRPIDMLKIGQLVKNKGVWEHKQIISKKWILESTLCDITIPDFSFMKSSRSKLGSPQPANYGYYWYKEILKTKDIQENLLFASGNGGQYIFIVENLNLTIVFTQGNYGSFKAKQAFEIMAKYILPNFKN